MNGRKLCIDKLQEICGVLRKFKSRFHFLDGSRIIFQIKKPAGISCNVAKNAGRNKFYGRDTGAKKLPAQKVKNPYRTNRGQKNYCSIRVKIAED